VAKKRLGQVDALFAAGLATAPAGPSGVGWKVAAAERRTRTPMRRRSETSPVARTAKRQTAK
jgi:hypothetical protein